MVGQLAEPLLTENPDRFCMFPIKYREVWEMYKKAEASFWTGAPRRTSHLEILRGSGQATAPGAVLCCSGGLKARVTAAPGPWPVPAGANNRLLWHSGRGGPQQRRGGLGDLER